MQTAALIGYSSPARQFRGRALTLKRRFLAKKETSFETDLDDDVPSVGGYPSRTLRSRRFSRNGAKQEANIRWDVGRREA